MHTISKIFSFYAKALVIILFVNIVLFFSLGTYFEEYEGMLSTFVHGTYTNYAIKEWNVDTHFLMFWFYAYINQLVPNIQVYGIVLFILNWSSLVFFGLVLFRILKVNIKNENITLFILFYTIVAIDYTVNLGSTRISFLITITIFGYIQSYIFEQKKISIYHWILLMLLYLMISLMRAEIVLLATLCYSSILLIHFKFTKHIFLFLMISIVVIFTYNIVATHFLTEARQVYYFKEFDFIDRENINYSKLSALQLFDVNAFRNYIISDKDHFTFKFYDSISGNISRFNFESLLHTFRSSFNGFKISWHYILLVIISGFMLLKINYQNRIRSILFFSFTFFFPVLLCFYLTIPQRFLVFYYSIIAVLNLILLTKNYTSKNIIVVVCFLFVSIFIYHEIRAKNNYNNIDKKVQKASKELINLTNKYSSDKPIVINTVEYMGRYFPVKPLHQFQRQNAMFLNFWYFGAYDCYIDKWKENCNCNPLSLKEKIDYIVSNQIVFITDTTSFNFMSEYVKLKYDKVLLRNDLGTFDGDLKICNLKYGN